MATRSGTVKIAKKYLGAKKYSTKHKKLVDTFNKKKPHGEVASYDSEWCAITWTAWMLLAGMTDDDTPMSYNCGTLVSDAKKLGIWVEDDNYKPRTGDGIIYDWDDNGKGDNTGLPYHVGLIVEVDGNTFTVIEGNYSTTNKVAYRTVKRNQQYIRGFITPKYKGSLICDVAKDLAHPYGTAKTKWEYETGAPTSKFKTASKKYGAGTSKITLSDCGNFVNVVVRKSGVDKEFKSIAGVNDKFPTSKKFKVVHEGKKVPSGFLEVGDIIRYKTNHDSQHVLIYVGNGRCAEGGRGTRFPVIRKTTKYNGKSVNKKSIEVLRAKQ